MQTRMEKFGAQLPLFAAASSSQRGGLFRKSTTYLAKVAVILQDAPGKMLTFPQLMEGLAPFISEDRKSFENNIRVCLSNNKCFIKTPAVGDSVDSKRNYWKLDLSYITAKMVRRHFKGNLQLFPELASKVKKETRRSPSEPLSSPGAAGVQMRREVKFNSPFSIESLLKRDSPSARASRAPPMSSGPVRVEQQQQPWPIKRSFSWGCEEPLLLQAAAGGSSIYSPHHGLTAKRMQLCSQCPVYTTAPSFTSPHSSYITTYIYP